MANFCVSEAGYRSAEAIRFGAVSTAATIRQGVAVAQFALNASDAISNFRKLRNVSSRGIAIEEEQHGHLKGTYWPAEEQMLDEFTQATPWDTQATLAKRYAGRIWAPLAAQYARNIRLLECNKPRYCANAHIKKMQELMAERSAARANVTLLADRIAYYEVEAVKETDFERRKQVIGLRQGLIGQAASLMQTAAQGFAGAGNMALAHVNNAIQTFGAATAEKNNASLGVGRDPYFHQQTARNVAQPPPDTFEADWRSATEGMAHQNKYFGGSLGMLSDRELPAVDTSSVQYTPPPATPPVFYDAAPPSTPVFSGDTNTGFA